MSEWLRIFINGTPFDVRPGTDVRTALLMIDSTLPERWAEGAASVTDARGIEVGAEERLAAGAILRVVVRSRRGGGSANADA